MKHRYAKFLGALVLLSLSAALLWNSRAANLGWGGKSAASSDPLVDIWYGSEQWFGELGNPQRWVNILGNASSRSGIASLRYSLNGSKWHRLGIGPDDRRLAFKGDFNAEIDVSELLDGLNTVEIAAVNKRGARAVSKVLVHYRQGKTWPMPYHVHWNTLRNIQEAAQVVDGQWKLEPDGIRPATLWYDRMVALGDMSWRDYEVTVPVTIHGFDPAAYNPISAGPMLGHESRHGVGVGDIARQQRCVCGAPKRYASTNQ